MKLNTLIQTIAEIHAHSQDAAGQALNQLLSLRNWLIGAWIVEYEQAGEDRAAYGDRVLHQLSEGLAKAGVKGLALRNLKNCRQVALAYPGFDTGAISGVFSAPFTIRQTSAELKLAAPSPPPDPSSQIRQTSAEFNDPREIGQTSGELHGSPPSTTWPKTSPTRMRTGP